jgi:hypothetical protein
MIGLTSSVSSPILSISQWSMNPWWKQGKNWQIAALSQTRYRMEVRI